LHTRIHNVPRQQVIKAFDEPQSLALLPLPSEPFPFFREALWMLQQEGRAAVASPELTPFTRVRNS